MFVLELAEPAPLFVFCPPEVFPVFVAPAAATDLLGVLAEAGAAPDVELFALDDDTVVEPDDELAEPAGPVEPEAALPFAVTAN